MALGLKIHRYQNLKNDFPVGMKVTLVGVLPDIFKITLVGRPSDFQNSTSKKCLFKMTKVGPSIEVITSFLYKIR